MENRFKLQISKLLQTTLNSCRPKNNSDVSDHRQTTRPTANNRRLIDLFSPKPQPLSSSTSKPNPHLSHLKPPQFPANSDRRRPISGDSVLPKPSKRDRKNKPSSRRRRNSAPFSSIADNYYYNWWSSDEDSDGKTTLFSRRSVSSDSFESVCKNRGRGNSGGGFGDRRVKGVVGLDGFALAKDSSDPYEDFRSSMVDMIVEKEMFGVEELENLVECFLELNGEEHHKVIVEVFAEIWETLVEDFEKKRELSM